MNAMRELDIEEIKNRLEEIRDELDEIAVNERFALERNHVSEEQYEEAETAIFSVADAASRIEEALEFVQEALK